MPLSVLYWILMLLWLVFGAWRAFPPRSDTGWMWGIIPFLLFILIGLKLFGSPIQG